MTDKDTNEDPLEFLHRKVVEEGEWQVEIVDAFGRSVRAGPRGGSDAPSPTDWEAEVKNRFVEEYSEAILDIDEVNDRYETGCFDWYWEIGKISVEQIDTDQRGVAWSKFQEIISIDILDDAEGDKILENARKVYELIPDGDPEPYLPDDVNPDNRITAFAQMAQNRSFESNEEARQFLRKAADANIKPRDRIVRTWSDVKDEEDASLDLIVERVNSRYKTYSNADTLADKTENIYTLLNRQDEMPDREEIIATVEDRLAEAEAEA